MNVPMSKILIFVLATLLIFFFSCQKVENGNMTSIKFGRVVDKYSGSLWTCTRTDMQMDTFCASPLRSEVSIIIINIKSIRISEKSNNFNVADLDIVDTLISTTGKIFFFRRVEEGIRKTLTFDEDQGLIEYVLTQNVNTVTNVAVFKGIQ